MSFSDFLMLTPNPVLSGFIWVVVLIAALYLARTSAHQVIRVTSRMVYTALRMAAHSITRAEQGLTDRNRTVLLAAGREAKERIIEREFDRVGDSVQKDLAGYPELSRGLSETITKIDEDHQVSADVPPPPPGWVKAVEAIAKIDRGGDGRVDGILADIHKSLVKSHEQALDEYRDSSRERHKLLSRMMPQWRHIQKKLRKMNKNVESILHRSRTIERHMHDYKEIMHGSDEAVQQLSSSSLVEFFVSGLVLMVAIGGAAINFSLIARPMAEMVGGTNFIGGFKTADIAALVIILVEISMGLFLMESMRITRLFPVIGALPDKVRVRMIYVTFTILALLASVEAGLAYMREILLQDELATSALLRGDGLGVVQNEFMWITTAAQMGMGFILPFALVFVAIPLETFIHSLRTVLGIMVTMVLRFLALGMRIIGSFFQRGASLLQRAYDMLIFLPLWIEEMSRKKSSKSEISSDHYSEVST